MFQLNHFYSFFYPNKLIPNVLVCPHNVNSPYPLLNLWLVVELLQLSFTVHCSLSAVTHAPFRASVLRPASQVGPRTRPQGWRKLVNAALLSLITEACVNVCCASLLSNELVGPACVQARSNNARGRACRPSEKGSGRRVY